MYESLDVKGIIVFLMVVSAVVGWAAIELIIWLFSFITISVG